MPNLNDPDSEIKFKLNLHKIGHFIPLRIWRYNGVEDILVGTIDLPLAFFDYDDDEEDSLKII